jgi:peptidoglycan/LPS O-acetylase OafA/YrhL
LLVEPTRQRFRPDINGLRAWAIGLVVLYHFDVGPLRGGFVGVDVFFVISGYLMTDILLREGTPSLGRFYARRARRVLPPLAAMSVVLLVLGAALLSAMEFETLAVEVATSLMGVSNFLFREQSGYFDVASREKWLLHSWSLSVEMQFYLAFPLLLRLIDRGRPWRLITLISVFSLVASLAVSPVQPATAFFLLPTRAWEFLVGALVRTMPRTRVNARRLPVAEYIGLALILTSAITFSAEVSWPSGWAAIPVLGAALVLSEWNSPTALTANPFAQWLGTRSYSVYLWHWPVAVALGFVPLPAHLPTKWLGIALSLVLGALSYALVERREWHIGARLGRAAWFVGLPGMALLVAFLIVRHDGFPGRMPPGVDDAAAEARNRHAPGILCRDNIQQPGRTCTAGSGRTGVVVIGDSHAESILGAVARAAHRATAGIEAWSYPSCFTLFDAEVVPGIFRSGARCREFNEWVRARLKELPANVPVLLVSRSSAYVHGNSEPSQRGESRPAIHFGHLHGSLTPQFEREYIHAYIETVCEMAERRPVFLLRPVAEMPVDVPRAVARSLAMRIERYPMVSATEYSARNRLVLAAQDAAATKCGAIILESRDVLCPTGSCQSTLHRRPLYYDDDHLSQFGSLLLVPLLGKIFDAHAHAK